MVITSGALSGVVTSVCGSLTATGSTDGVGNVGAPAFFTSGCGSLTGKASTKGVGTDWSPVGLVSGCCLLTGTAAIDAVYCG